MMIRVATVQFEPRPGAQEYNFARVERFARAAADDAVQLVAFPELCLIGNRHLARRSPGYLRRLAEPEDGPSITRVRALAQRLGTGIGVGLLTERDGRCSTPTRCACPTAPCTSTASCTPPRTRASPTATSYTVFDTPWGARVGVADLPRQQHRGERAVDGAARRADSAGTAPDGRHALDDPVRRRPDPGVGMGEPRGRPRRGRGRFRGATGREWLLRCLPARAHDNGMFIVFSNGVGRDDDEVRTGNAMLVDPCGRIIAESLAITDDMVAADLDLDQAAASVGQWWLRFRWPELYRPLVRQPGDVDAAAAG